MTTTFMPVPIHLAGWFARRFACAILGEGTMKPNHGRRMLDHLSKPVQKMHEVGSAPADGPQLRIRLIGEARRAEADAPLKRTRRPKRPQAGPEVLI